MRILGLIPARGGSKGVPGKNIRLLAGEPLIAHSIKAGKRCPKLDRLILSTDDEQIAAVGRQYGLEVPFLRPAHLATDEAAALDVFQHALKFVLEQGYEPDALLVLQPTSPLRDENDIERAIELFVNGEFDQVITVTEVSQHPGWMKTMGNNSELQPFLQETAGSLRRQDLPQLYIPNGAIYIYRTEYILNPQPNHRVGAVIMEPWKSIDIDNPLDFFLAEQVMEAKNNGNLGRLI